jgi:hypothetical protein
MERVFIKCNLFYCDWVADPDPDFYSLRSGLDPMPLLVVENICCKITFSPESWVKSSFL